MTSKGKRLTRLTIALGVVVLLAAGYASRDLAVEQWYIWKLESEDEETRKAAAQKLGEMRCLRAVPSLMRQIERSEAEISSRRYIFVWDPGPPRSFHQPRELHERYEKRYRDQEWEKNWAGKALVRIGTPAIPAMIASFKLDVCSRRASMTSGVVQLYPPGNATMAAPTSDGLGQRCVCSYGCRRTTSLAAGDGRFGLARPGKNSRIARNLQTTVGGHCSSPAKEAA